MDSDTNLLKPLALAFAAVMGFASGFVLGVTVYDARAETKSCEIAKENATRFAAALAQALNGGEIETKDVTAKCRVQEKP